MGMLIIAILGLNYEALVPDVREASIKTIIMFGISYDVLYILCCHIWRDSMKSENYEGVSYDLRGLGGKNCSNIQYLNCYSISVSGYKKILIYLIFQTNWRANIKY